MDHADTHAGRKYALGANSHRAVWRVAALAALVLCGSADNCYQVSNVVVTQADAVTIPYAFDNASVTAGGNVKLSRDVDSDDYHFQLDEQAIRANELGSCNSGVFRALLLHDDLYLLQVRCDDDDEHLDIVFYRIDDRSFAPIEPVSDSAVSSLAARYGVTVDAAGGLSGSPSQLLAFFHGMASLDFKNE